MFLLFTPDFSPESGAMELLVVLCTFPNLDSARQIGTALVEAQLAACVNLCPAVESIYRWQGKVESAAEVLALIKTTRAGFEALERKLVELHPYEVPEIIALPPEKVSHAYAKWVQDSVAPP
jgi:periplasmic divalent cation tolerance protein